MLQLCTSEKRRCSRALNEDVGLAGMVCLRWPFKSETIVFKSIASCELLSEIN